ncbi:MAG: hypothetical protein ACOY5H_12300 [Pseudomonadota bacterium]
MPRLMRIAVLSLVLGSLLLGVWQLRSVSPRSSGSTVATLQPFIAGADAPVPVTSPETTSGVVASRQEAPVSVDSAPVRCWRIGPLDEAGARAAKTRFAAPEYAMVVSQEVQRDKVADWIYLPPRPTLAAARDEERRLRDLGVQDLAVVTNGAMRNGLSLGLYAEAGGALRRMAELKDLGVEARIEPRYRERRQTYIIVRAVDAPQFEPAAGVSSIACPQ